jgi:hypothetical protein
MGFLHNRNSVRKRGSANGSFDGRGGVGAGDGKTHEILPAQGLLRVLFKPMLAWVFDACRRPAF